MDEVIYLIVEGDGETAAAPLLVRDLLLCQHFQRCEFQVNAYNAHGNGNIVAPGKLEKILEVTRISKGCVGVIILLDSEREYRDCPPKLAYQLAHRARALGLPFPVAVVCATCEFESWFLANLHTEIRNWLIPGAKFEGDPEKECGAKGWLKRNMPKDKAYNEARDQVKMTTRLDIPRTIAHSRSFRRMANAVKELLDAIDAQVATVTPLPTELDAT